MSPRRLRAGRCRARHTTPRGERAPAERHPARPIEDSPGTVGGGGRSSASRGGEGGTDPVGAAHPAKPVEHATVAAVVPRSTERRVRSRPLARGLLVLVAGGLFACNEGRNPYRQAPSPECEACLQGDAGCGPEQATCAGDSACDEAFLCSLRAGCFEEAAGDACRERFGCVPSEGEPAARFSAIEACAHDRCATACGYVASERER